MHHMQFLFILVQCLMYNIGTSFQIKKPRKTPNTAFYGVFYCRQRGSNPHRVGVYTYVYRNRAEYHSKPIKKRAEPLPRPYEKSVHAVTFSSNDHITVFIKNVVSTPILCALLGVVKGSKSTLLRVRFLPRLPHSVNLRSRVVVGGFGKGSL